MITVLTGLTVLLIAGLIAAVGLLAGRDDDLWPSPVRDLVSARESGGPSGVPR